MRIAGMSYSTASNMVASLAWAALVGQVQLGALLAAIDRVGAD
jgi:hypothetical protein